MCEFKLNWQCPEDGELETEKEINELQISNSTQQMNFISPNSQNINVVTKHKQ